MSEVLPRSEFVVWFREKVRQPWRVVNWAGNYTLAVHLIGVGQRGGDWMLLPVRQSPAPDCYTVPTKATLPPKVTGWDQLSGR